MRRGVVAVEAAVVLPVLIIVMFGMWEVGRLIQVNQIVTNAAREGARLAAGGYVNGTPVTSRHGAAGGARLHDRLGLAAPRLQRRARLR